jgi:putative NADH-flavin reductase
MTRKLIRISLGLLLAVVAIAYISQLGEEYPMEATNLDTKRHGTIAIFGGTGTAGDGILKAVMEDSDVARAKLFTRRHTERINEGVSSGQVLATMHTDYLDYDSAHDHLKDVDTVFWALGTSARNVSKEDYSVIHIEYPMAFVKEWLKARPTGEKAFHLVSGEGASLDSRMHWAREKAKAEQALTALAEGSNLRVVIYRPSWIVAAEEQTNWTQEFGFAIFRPVKLAIRSTAIGSAMLEVSARGEELPNGTILQSNEIQQYANAYEKRTTEE